MNDKTQKTISDRQAKTKELVIEQLKRLPIVQVACERSGIGRATYYRWRNEDKWFAKATDEALAEGEAMITDMSESQLISLIKDRNFQALQLWLRHHHPKYGNRVEVVGNLKVAEDILTPEQESLVAEALRLAVLPEHEDVPKYDNEPKS